MRIIPALCAFLLGILPSAALAAEVISHIGARPATPLAELASAPGR